MRILIKNEVINTNFMVRAYVLNNFLHIKYFHLSLGPYTSDNHTVIEFDDEDQALRTLKMLESDDGYQDPDWSSLPSRGEFE